MSKRVLLSCSVISVQDCRFLYPSCKQCVTKLTSENEHRYTCQKCRFTCDAENVDYRYRLSLKVVRDTNLFGVTVFGGCLTPFFGRRAGELHRYLETDKHQGPPSLHHLLIKAVDDCFIGKSFTFGFKLSGLESERCLLGGQTYGLNAELANFVAYQVIPLSRASLGITVFDYLQNLRQANAQPSCTQKAVNQLQQDSQLCSFDHTLPSCLSSQFECSVGSSNPWQAMPGLVLCFSPECSELSLDKSSVSVPDMDPKTLTTGDAVDFYDLKGDLIRCNAGSPTISPVPSKLHMPLFSPIPYSSNTTPAPHVSESHTCSHWSPCSCKCDASLKPITTSDDAPLSETLGNFVTTPPFMTYGNGLNVHTPKSKRHKKHQIEFGKIYFENLTSCFGQSATMHGAMRRPFCNITNEIKSKDHKTLIEQFSTAKSSTLHNPVLKRKSLKRKKISKNSMVIKEQGAMKSLEETHEDEYNCSADMFHQNSIDTIIPDFIQRPVSHMDPKKKEPLLQFAPSLQSTPIGHSYKQRWELRNTWARDCKEEKTQVNCYKVIKKRGDPSQRANMEFNQTQSSDTAFQQSNNFANGYKAKDMLKHEDTFIIDDCSRELFD